MTQQHSTARRKYAIWFGVFAIIWIVALAVPFYNRIDPTLLGIPFFYWFQFVWIIVGAITTFIAYKARV